MGSILTAKQFFSQTIFLEFSIFISGSFENDNFPAPPRQDMQKSLLLANPLCFWPFQVPKTIFRPKQFSGFSIFNPGSFEKKIVLGPKQFFLKQFSGFSIFNPGSFEKKIVSFKLEKKIVLPPGIFKTIFLFSAPQAT
jgi:hypothetical protein